MPLKALTNISRHPAVAPTLWAAAFLWSGSALAFSQIGAEDGSATQKEGIVSVPLPPLPGANSNDPAAASPMEGVPSAEDAGPPAAPADAGSDIATPPPATPAAPPATDSPAEDGAQAPAATDAVPTPADPSANPTAMPQDAPSRPGTPVPTDGNGVPMPSPDVPSTQDDAPLTEEGAEEEADAPSAASAEPALPPAQIFHGEEGLPTPVRDLRAKLMEIARTGEVEALRPYIEVGEEPTILTFGGMDGDPIDYLKSASGDGEGIEVLAILLEVLQAAHIRSEPATDNEIFVWPYFTGVPIDGLTAPQKVELFEIVTAGDYQEMLGFGAYNFYRAGISPDGKLQFFVAGD